MKTKIILGVIIASVITGGSLYFLSVKQSTEENPSVLESTTTTEKILEESPAVPATTTVLGNESPSVPPMKTYMLAEISRHASRTDCWFAIEGGVYDVSGYIASGNHPGGEEIIQGCGKDATSLFNSKPNNGTPHSSKAIQYLEKFYIGKLVK